jgi:hypothetical protein
VVSLSFVIRRPVEAGIVAHAKITEPLLVIDEAEAMQPQSQATVSELCAVEALSHFAEK